MISEKRKTNPPSFSPGISLPGWLSRRTEPPLQSLHLSNEFHADGKQKKLERIVMTLSVPRLDVLGRQIKQPVEITLIFFAN